jgi:hypothetical protein
MFLKANARRDTQIEQLLQPSIVVDPKFCRGTANIHIEMHSRPGKRRAVYD